MEPTRRRGHWSRALLWASAGLLATQAWAQGAAAPLAAEPKHTVHLSARAQQRVPHDWLAVTVGVRHQAPDAAQVQAHLRRTLEQALARARSLQQPGQLEVVSGGVQVQPRYGRDGQIAGWEGRAEVLLQGRDLERVATVASELPGMSIAALQLSLSREATQLAEAALRAQAIEAFRQQAQDVARAFGYAGYELGQVHIGVANAGGDVSRPVMRTLSMASAESAPSLPVEPGHAWLEVTVSGSVHLTPAR